MHKRIDAGTDVAIIGAWDAASGQTPFTASQLKRPGKALEQDAQEGRLFLIHTGADGGGAVDVYVDEDLPVAVQHATQSLDGTFLLAVPGGRLIVGGAEDYRSGLPRRITNDDSVIDVLAGDYAVCCHIADEDEEGEELSLTEVEAKTLSAEEREYYHRKNYRRIGRYVVGWLLFLAYFPLSRRFGWKIALPVTLAVALPYFHWLEWFVKRRSAANTRWQEIRKKLLDAWLANQPRAFVLELRRVSDRGDLKGGSVWLDGKRQGPGKGFDVLPSAKPPRGQ